MALTANERIEQLTGEVHALRLYIEALNYLMTITSENKETVGPQSRKAFEKNVDQVQEEFADTPIALEMFNTTLEEIISTGNLALLNLEKQ